MLEQAELLFNIAFIVQAKSELGTTKRGNLSHVVFLDQNVMENKNILGKKPKSWTYPLKRGILYGGPDAKIWTWDEYR